MALLAALAFIIALFVAHPGFDTAVFWELVGLALLSVAHVWEFPYVSRRSPH